jgi:GNAT superfamily N-acetyltransferase
MWAGMFLKCWLSEDWWDEAIPPDRQLFLTGSTMDYTIIAAAEPGYADREAILAPLVCFNEQQAGPTMFAETALLVRDGDGATIGGLWARTAYDWMFVELLVVPARLRGSGVGSALMRRAEDLARAQGCAGIWLDTFSFQARPFYEKLGYSVFGALPDHPRGKARYFLQKRLD